MLSRTLLLRGMNTFWCCMTQSTHIALVRNVTPISRTQNYYCAGELSQLIASDYKNCIISQLILPSVKEYSLSHGRKSNSHNSEFQPQDGHTQPPQPCSTSCCSQRSPCTCPGIRHASSGQSSEPVVSSTIGETSERLSQVAISEVCRISFS